MNRRHPEGVRGRTWEADQGCWGPDDDRRDGKRQVTAGRGDIILDRIGGGCGDWLEIRLDAHVVV